MTNTREETKTLEGRDFPLVFKICIQPSFSKPAAFQDAGYKSLYHYFLGQSRFNSSIYGWAGHASNLSGLKSTVKLVYNNISRATPQNAIDYIYLQFSDGKLKLNLSHNHVYLQRVNYPMNCFTLNLTKHPQVKEHGLQTMSFYFKKAKTNITHVQINVQGSHIAGYRDLFDHSFYSTGDAIEGKTGFLSKYGVEIRENVFVEDDQSKHCVDYPTVKFENFGDCDNQYMLDTCAKEGVLPIWLVDNFEHVTTYHTYQQSFGDDKGNI